MYYGVMSLIIKVSAFVTLERSWYFAKGWLLPDSKSQVEPLLI